MDFKMNYFVIVETTSRKIHTGSFSIAVPKLYLEKDAKSVATRLNKFANERRNAPWNNRDNYVVLKADLNIQWEIQ
jgi:hypothetical protein